MPSPTASPLAPMIRKLMKRSELEPRDIAALEALPCRMIASDAGTYLVREGDKPKDCLVLLSGFVYRSKITGEGARQILAVHLSGDLIDLESGLLNAADYSLQALTCIEGAYIPHQALLEVAEEHPAIGRALWRETLVDGAIYREWILNVGRRNSRQRISHLLCELALRQEAAGLCDGPNYAWPMTQEQIGDATGLTSVHVNRTIQSMRSDGLISITNRSVTINDWHGLSVAGDFRRAYLHEVVPQAA